MDVRPCHNKVVNMETETLDQRWRKRVLLFYLIAAFIEGVEVFIYLLRIPGDPTNAWLFGLSKTRLLLAIMNMMGVGIFGFLAIKFWRDDSWGTRFLSSVQQRLSQNLIYYATIVGLFLVGLVSSHLIWFSTVLTNKYVLGYLSRLLPFIIWIGLLGWQTVIVLPVLRYGKKLEKISTQGKVFRVSLLVFVILLVLWLLIAVTGFGITPDEFGWHNPGAPVLPLQVWISWVFAVLYFLFEVLAYRKIQINPKLWRWIDVLISVIVFVTAVFIWNAEPMDRAYFAPKVRPPNFELYPYSDAALYDSSALQVLIGEGFSHITRKPLYVLFLALANKVANFDYNVVASLQVIVLSAIPVCMYWLAKSMHSRFAGIFVALIFILREKNAIALSADIKIVHARLLMSDMPVALGIIVFSWLLILWLQNPSKRRWYPFLVGGVIGLAMLIRSNLVIVLPFIVLVCVILFYRRPLGGIVSLGLLVAGLLITIAPWLWRSFQLTGRASFNDPRQVAYHAELYTHEVGSLQFPQLPGESDEEYINRLNDHVVEFTLQNPGVVAGFIIPHVLNNQIGLLLNLPMTPWLIQDPSMIPFYLRLGDWAQLWQECCSATNYVDQMPYWEEGWQGFLTSEMVFVLAINLVILAVGVGSMWVMWDFVGLIPLGVGLAYSLSTAIARFSGWRFALPVSWVTFFYFAVGLAQITFWVIRYLSHRSFFLPNSDPEQNSWKRIDRLELSFSGMIIPILLTGLVLLALGLSPLITEWAIKPKYKPLERDAGVEIFAEMGLSDEISQFSDDVLELYFENERAITLQGMAFYPRFYLEGEGESGGGWHAYAPLDYSRLGFTLIGPAMSQIVLPMDNPPSYFPNGVEVVVVGCRLGDYVVANAVVLLNDTSEFWVHAPNGNFACSESR